MTIRHYRQVLLALSGLLFFSFQSDPPLPMHTYVRATKRDFTPQTEAILARALVLADSVINTPAFRQGIRDAHFLENGGLSNEQILALFLHGHEVHKPINNDTLDLVLSTYPDQDGNNIGSTFGAERIVSSQAYIVRNGAKCYAAHLIHEYCHTLGTNDEGFEHLLWDYNKKRRRKKCQSVPYIIGDLARKILAVPTCHCECEDYPQT